MKRVLLPLAAALLLAFASVGTASAAPPVRETATPSNACAIMVQFKVGGYASFADCMRNLHADMAAYRFPSDDPNGGLLTLSQRCSELEAGVFDPVENVVLKVTYPFVFTEFPGWPFPTLTGYNHQQCEYTLFTYHSLAVLLGPPPA